MRKVEFRDALTLVLMTLIVLLLIPLFYAPSEPAREGGGELGKLPELFVESIYHLNYSSSAALEALESPLNNITGNAYRAEEVRKKLSELRKELMGREGDLARKLERATEEYIRVVGVAGKLYGTAQLINKTREGLEEFLGYLLNCDVASALSTWREVRGEVAEVKRELRNVLLELSDVDLGELLSKKHVEAVDEASEKVTKILEVIDEVEKLASIVERNSETIEFLCKARKGQGGACPSEVCVLKLAREMRDLDPRRAGPFSYEISRIKGLLRQGTSSMGQGGTGAGYGEPSTDD